MVETWNVPISRIRLLPEVICPKYSEDTNTKWPHDRPKHILNVLWPTRIKKCFPDWPIWEEPHIYQYIYIEVTHWPYIARCIIIGGKFIWFATLKLLVICHLYIRKVFLNRRYPRSWETHIIPDSDVDNLRLDAPLRQRNWSTCTYFVRTVKQEIPFLRIKQKIPNQRIS